MLDEVFQMALMIKQQLTQLMIQQFESQASEIESKRTTNVGW